MIYTCVLYLGVGVDLLAPVVAVIYEGKPEILVWTDCLILCPIGDSAPYSKSELCAVLGWLTIN